MAPDSQNAQPLYVGIVNRFQPVVFGDLADRIGIELGIDTVTGEGFLDPDDFSAAGVDGGWCLVEIGRQWELDPGVQRTDQNRMAVFDDSAAPGRHKRDYGRQARIPCQLFAEHNGSSVRFNPRKPRYASGCRGRKEPAGLPGPRAA